MVRGRSSGSPPDEAAPARLTSRANLRLIGSPSSSSEKLALDLVAVEIEHPQVFLGLEVLDGGGRMGAIAPHRLEIDLVGEELVDALVAELSRRAARREAPCRASTSSSPTKISWRRYARSVTYFSERVGRLFAAELLHHRLGHLVVSARPDVDITLL